MTTIYGTIVEDTIYTGVIEFDKEIISCYPSSSPPPHARVFDSDHLIFPGFIDINTNCCEDGPIYHQEWCFLTAGMAALNGGVTFIVDSPNGSAPPIDAKSYDTKVNIVKSCPVGILLYAGVYFNTSPFSSDIPYKVFIGDNELSFDKYYYLDTTLSKYKNLAVSFQCECPIHLKHYRHSAKHELRRPQVCEIKAIEAAVGLINKYGLRGKICNVSTIEGLNIINSNRHVGSHVYAEITPHHLYFDIDMITTENRAFLQVNPPLRTRYDCNSMMYAVKHGEFEFLATNHSHPTIADKIAGASGIPHLDTYGAFVSWMIKNGVDPIRIFRMCCLFPGLWVNSFNNRKIGRIQPGYEASITVLNMNKSMADCRGLYSKCNWSPFDLRELPGSVETVYLNGEKVVDGEYIKNF